MDQITFGVSRQLHHKWRVRSCPVNEAWEECETEANMTRTSQGNLGLGRCHCIISQNTIAQEKTSTLWLYFGWGCHSSGACQFTVPTKLLTIERVDCLTFASPKSVIFATPLEVTRIFEDLQSRWITDGLCEWRYWRPRAISSIMQTFKLVNNVR